MSSAYSKEALRSADMFRLQMDAMAHPGGAMEFPPCVGGVGALNPVALSVAETLCDHETPIWLDARLSTQDVIDTLRFRCGCPITTDASDASFAFFSESPNIDVLRGFPDGTPDYPDRSTTLVIQVSHIANEGSIKISGPGVKETGSLGIHGLESGFWTWRHENLRKFPLGIDVLLASPTHLTALPRTTVATEIA